MRVNACLVYNIFEETIAVRKTRCGGGGDNDGFSLLEIEFRSQQRFNTPPPPPSSAREEIRLKPPWKRVRTACLTK